MKPASHWNESRQNAALDGVFRRVKRRRRLQQSAAAATALAALAFFAWTQLPAKPASYTEQAPTAIPTAPKLVTSGRFEFADGSRAELLRDETRLFVEQDSESRVHTSLERGQAQFYVTKKADRWFEVTTEFASVRVVGTEFEVETDLAREQTRVRVNEGRVEVHWKGPNPGKALLEAGNERWFPPPVGGTVADYAVADAAIELDPVLIAPENDSGVQAEKPNRKTKAKRALRGWQALAQKGKYHDAFAALRDSKDRVDGAGELWLAVDAARRSGHPAESLPYLKRLLDEHPKDSRAALAAFTLGRVYMQLGKDKQAADAFARVRRMAADASLREDALAREVQTASASGQSERARKRAAEYLTRYPQGRRVREVKRVLPDRE